MERAGIRSHPTSIRTPTPTRPLPCTLPPPVKYDFLDSAVLARLGALPVEARLAMIGNVAGKHRSPHRGSSVEFAEYR